MSDLTTTFTNIANAIRSKTGSSDTMTPSEMPNEIAEIETPMDSINITQNGTYEPSTGRGYNQVIVEVPAPTLITKTITENGTYAASEDNADGYSQVTVNVPYMEKKSASGDIASFSDGAGYPFLKVKANINPVQDLHGYDYPWVGGANLNLLRPGEAKTYTSNGITFTSDGSGKYTIKGTATAGVNCIFDCEEYTIPDGSNTTLMFMNTATNPNIAFEFYRDTTLVDNWSLSVTNRMQCPFTALSQKTVNKYNIFVAVGSTVDMTISPMFITGDVTANPPSFRPYSNICPISGFTGVNVDVFGKNLFDKSNPIQDNYYNNDGVEQTSANTGHSELMPCYPNTYYTLSGTLKVPGGTFTTGFYFWDANKNWISRNVTIETGAQTVLTPPNCRYISLQLSTPQGAPSSGLQIDTVQVEQGSSATAYEAYNSNSHVYPISWQDEAGIVYGGYIDLVSGVLTVTKAGVDLGTLAWDYDSSYLRMFARLASMKQATARTLELMCSQYRTISDGRVITNVPNGSIYNAVDNNVSTIFIHDTAYTNSVAFKTAMSGQTLVYDLATPQTYNLTPQQINTLIGQNNAWNDVNGQTEVEYFIPIE